MAEADPRDLNTIPTAFGDGRFNGDPKKLREPNPVGPGVTYGSIYYVYGSPQKGLPRSAIDDPPCSGWSIAFCLDEDAKHVRLFHPWTMKSWRVAKGSYELMSYQGDPGGFPHDRFAEGLRRCWAEFRRRGDAVAHYDVAARVMKAMGVVPPTDEEIGNVPPMERGPQPVEHKPAPAKRADGSGVFRKVKKDGRRGEVLAFFLDAGGTASIDEAMAKFKITRSNLLSQLFLLRKEHGVGYSVNGGQASVQLPEGVTEPFK